MILADGAIDLRLGDWREVLADVESCDAVICDPPYSERVVRGQRSAGPQIAAPGRPQEVLSAKIHYAGWSEVDAREFVKHWFPRVRRWFVMFCSDDIASWARAALADLGCEFAWSLPNVYDDDDMPAMAQTLPWCKPDAAPAFNGIMPSPQTEWIVVARPRGPCVRRYRPGWYSTPQARGEDFIGTKPLALMCAVVRDYSELDDVVVDPFCGLGKTAEACVVDGRKCITSEVDPTTHTRAIARLSKPITPSMFSATTARAKAQELF